MQIAILGPQGTFSHEAALALDSQATVVFERTIRDVVDKVGSGGAESGLIPLENSVAGSVGETLDALTDTDLTILREVIHPVVQNLAGLAATTEVRTVLAHPQSYAQCENFLRRNYAAAEIVQTSSNGRSAEMLLESGRSDMAAIVPELAISLYGLTRLRAAIQDNRYNVTRFVQVGREMPSSSGYDRTSLALYPQTDHPGLLFKLLGQFAQRGVNLSKIESRPSKGRLGDYIFFVDVQGHIQDQPVAEALEQLRKMAFIKVLGSYPRQY